MDFVWAAILWSVHPEKDEFVTKARKTVAVIPPLVLTLNACSSASPGSAALEALISDEAVTVTLDDWISLEPSETATAQGLIFYPGGLVEPEAYAPPMRQMAEAGVPTFILSVPADLAIFGSRRAQHVIDAHPDITSWVVAGHSLGGVAAAKFAFQHPDTIHGLALWAAYPQNKHDLSESSVDVVSLVGSKDGVLDWDRYRASAEILPEHTIWLALEGGNHAQFGDYGVQEGDEVATIDAEAQWTWAVDGTLMVIQMDEE